uniref:ATP citrate synthase n=1 Tax=Dunaliella tertiolecta TaxID=3047 RepID=A0A1L7B7K5_DUNTE|nr:ATP-citrate lyase small subunit [Dunaliella tertiolecta]APT69333.1 ATP-citrate lyase small subunit [Dunaliella tertiolecta]
MARKKVREYDAKRILRARFEQLTGKTLPIHVAQVTAATDYKDLLQQNQWLGSSKLVVKPDMLFGQRGKHDLVGLNLTWSQAETFIRERLGRTITVNECTGPVTTFIVEPFMPHTEEMYMCIQSKRLEYELSFSAMGGISIEEHWDQLGSIKVDATVQGLSSDDVAPLTAKLPLELRNKVGDFIQSVFKVFLDVDATLIEMNPFTFDLSGQPFPLDIRMELDDTAQFRSGHKWCDAEFPLPFGRTLTPAEESVQDMDERTGASLKFTVLNPRGRVWLMVAGGGASVIYTDTVADLGFAQELGNYGEYSGAPNTQETYQYARTVLSCATAHSDGRPRALLIGGGIANFTNVAATFQGIIRALRESSEALKAAKVSVFVRRGGPNYLEGLEMMRALGKEIGIPIEVYGPESSMTGICSKAISKIKAEE